MTFLLAMPDDLNEALGKAARCNGRSLSDEINARLYRSLREAADQSQVTSAEFFQGARDTLKMVQGKPWKSPYLRVYPKVVR